MHTPPHPFLLASPPCQPRLACLAYRCTSYACHIRAHSGRALQRRQQGVQRSQDEVQRRSITCCATGPSVHRTTTYAGADGLAGQLLQCCTPCWTVCQNAVLVIRAYMDTPAKSNADEPSVASGGYITPPRACSLHDRAARHCSSSNRGSEVLWVCLLCSMWQ
jgi:hypothetical protein